MNAFQCTEDSCPNINGIIQIPMVEIEKEIHYECLLRDFFYNK